MPTSQGEGYWDEIDRILWEEWDPIGVNNSSAARDEYQSYISKIATMLAEGRDQFALTRHLVQLRTHAIGLRANDSEDERVARLIVALKRG